MTTQTTDQGLVIPDFPEAANGPLALNGLATGGLESRLVKRYLSAADRTTRNPLPQTNELSIRGDAAAPVTYERFDGTNWVPPWPLGFIGRTVRSVATAAITTVETVVDTLTFTAVTGRRYKFTYFTIWTSDVADDVALFRLRYQAGAALTTGGTSVVTHSPNADKASRPLSLTFTYDVTGIAAGQTTIGMTLVRGAGTGNLKVNTFSETNGTLLLLEDVGT